MSGTYRILVTGSRTWKDWVTVWTALEDAVEAAYKLGYTSCQVRHGCAGGADRIAADWCEDHAAWYDNAGQELSVDPHPADWGRHGRRAGFVRNAEMVALGADVCLAFIDPCADAKCRKSEPHGSHGASRTADLAEKAGIRTTRYPLED